MKGSVLMWIYPYQQDGLFIHKRAHFPLGRIPPRVNGSNILKVLGDSGDKVNAAGFSDSAIDRTVDGITYDVYTHGDANTSACGFIHTSKMGCSFINEHISP
jgi:hypothetical protein